MSNWEKTLGLVRFGDGERMRVQYGSDRVCVCAQSSLNFCDPIDCSLPGSSVQGISQARILEWVVIYSSRGSSPSRDGTRVSHVCWQVGSIPLEPPGKFEIIPRWN